MSLSPDAKRSQKVAEFCIKELFSKESENRLLLEKAATEKITVNKNFILRVFKLLLSYRQ